MPTEITKAQYAIFVKDFLSIDKNRNGALDDDELVDLLRLQLEAEPTESQKKEFVAQVDRNNDGKISFHEYICMIAGVGWYVEGHAQTIYNPNLSEEQLDAISKVIGTPEMAMLPTEDVAEALRHHFSRADANNTECLAKPELRACLSDHFSLPEAVTERIMAAADAVDDCENGVKCQQFVSIVMSVLGQPPPPPAEEPPAPPLARVRSSLEEDVPPPPEEGQPA